MEIEIVCDEKDCYWNISARDHWWEFWFSGKRICAHVEPKLNLANNCASCYTYISEHSAQRIIDELSRKKND